MKKLKLFLENFLIYGFGGIISKLVPLVMVPIVTRLMPNSSYFGISDMSNTVVSFGSSLAVMGMYDAMYRMFFEKDDEDYQKEICSTTLIFTLMTSAVIFLIMLVMKDFIADKFFGDTKYTYLVYITAIATLVGATNNIICAPTRMQNKRKVFVVMNALSPLVSYGISIPLLLTGHYIIALPVAGVISGFSCEVIFWILNKEWFNFKKFRKEYLKPLLWIAIPLLPNFLIYWIFSSSDKLMITNLIGTAATGVYSVGGKLGNASQLIYTAFAGGWQFFAFSTMKEKDQVKSNSQIFEYLGIISFVCAMGIFIICKPLYELLFTGEYVVGYIISPYLFLAPLLQMLFQVACNQFLVIKKTWPNIFILSTGAIVNIVLNLVLIPKIGIEGAAVATLVGYVVSDIIVVIVLMKMRLMVMSIQFVIATLLMTGFILLWRFAIGSQMLVSIIVALIITICYGWLYRRDLKTLFEQIRNR